MKNIILSTYISESSRNACMYAIKLFGDKDVKYTLMNTYLDPNLEADPLTSILDILREKSNKDLEEELIILRKNNPKLLLNMSKESIYSDHLQGINYLCTESKYEYVVMGTKGKDDGNWLLGSSAKNISRNSPVPVFVVPKDAKLKSMSKIVYALDLHEDESLVINRLIEFAKLYNAYITILHIDNMSQNINWSIKELKQTMKDSKYDNINFEELVGENIGESIIKYASDIKADLLVARTRTTTFFKKIFHRSLTKKILNQSIIPVLIYNGKNHK